MNDFDPVNQTNDTPETSPAPEPQMPEPIGEIRPEAAEETKPETIDKVNLSKAQSPDSDAEKIVGPYDQEAFIKKEKPAPPVQQGFTPNFQQSSPAQGFTPNMQQGGPAQGFTPNMQQGGPAQSFTPNMQQGSPAQGFNPNMQQGSPAQGFNPNMQQGTPMQENPMFGYPQQRPFPEQKAMQQSGEVPPQFVPQPMGQQPYGGYPGGYMPYEQKNNMATWALVCGIASFLGCCSPIIGLILAVVTFILADKAKKTDLMLKSMQNPYTVPTDNSGKITASIICAIIGILISIINVVAALIMIQQMGGVEAYLDRFLG